MRANRTTLPRPRGSHRSVIAVALVLSAAFGLSACGDDTPSKEEFTSKIGTVTGGKVTPELAECVYTKLGKSDGELLLKASETPNLTDAEDKRLTLALAGCIVDQDAKDNPPEPTTTTTSEKE